jgi:hypothetical protein
MTEEVTDCTDQKLATSLQRALESGAPIFKVVRDFDEFQESKQRSEVLDKPEKRRNGNSLKKICMRILRLYHKKEEEEIFLNEFSMCLNIERRRIYDIVNILEALDIVVKKSKNLYIWKSIATFVKKLRILSAAGSNLAEQLKLFHFETKPMTSKKKMLTYLALRVLKLFYTTNSVLSFSEIMKICEEHYSSVQASMSLPPGDEVESKNRIRRLYDIINVFKALGLISKVSSKSEKKIYVWQGEGGFQSQLAKLCPSDQQETLPMTSESRSLSQEVSLGKRMEHSAFRLCQKFENKDLPNLKNVFSVPGQQYFNRGHLNSL